MKKTKKSRSWKMERRKKYLKGADKGKKPAANTRSKFWVKGYVRNGKKIKGHWRKNPNFTPLKKAKAVAKKNIAKLKEEKKKISKRLKKKPRRIN